MKSSAAASASRVCICEGLLQCVMDSTEVDMTPVPAGEGSSVLAGPSTSTKKGKRFEIKKWNAVALWAWGTSKFLCSMIIIRKARIF